MSTNRRNFIKKTAIGAVGVTLGSTSVNAMSAKSYSKIIGANDRLNVALQGLGRRYGGYIPAIADKSNNIELLYLCDVMKSQREKAANALASKIDNKPKLENDLRNILNDKEVDAVFMATPDHWHAPGACMAMQAGKHVYLEKPCSHNPEEGELLVAYQKKYDKVVQMGNQQRSSLQSQEIINDIHNGIIGDVYNAIAFYTNKRGRVPNQVEANPPEGLDWELFQGPAPRRAYTDNTWDYNWHWYGWDYGTAEMGNNATHELDIARWALNVEYPEHVEVKSGKFQHKDDGWEMYDTMEATFRFAGNRTIQWDGRSRNGFDKYGKGRGTLVYGSKGATMIDRDGYRLYGLNGELIKENVLPGIEDGNALGGGGQLSAAHTVNFFDAIRGKAALTSPIDQGVTSQLLTHYANIASRIDNSFEVDEKTGRIFNREAMKLWSRSYEPGWEIKHV
ncbi:twin-arginine translocation signal domain-containing protein [Aggregatimonas sangjinii]|uniref:Twin-arginine translocation signal domain-containing protein n=1 Tax=Aggregatimonas sangjinii TaxID=2583587 RepID=A0A5B7SR85_9FLAO|nr:Gfo/Idh/MocA family oxidoreductase [Aggregatimonas sangjinii]QCW99487.1 twin-arginine translocation signal domain-containing protein [Aggregatimonas sangjinii]